ncbi:MAG: L,D-transpeptidase family protein [Actinobacteria bacterium]|nr:L,D-transpeptidase family protein [Actinomycetota bacterium]
MRSRRVVIGLAVAAIALVFAAVGAWAYDHGRRDTIAKGVRIGGVDVGGMSTAQARATLRSELLSRLRRPVVVTYDGRRVVLSARRAGVAVNVDAALDAALARSRDGWFGARVARELSGGSVRADVQPRVVYSRLAVAHFVAQVGDGFDRPARDASIDFTPTKLAPVTGQDGVTVERRPLRRAIVHALTTPAAPHTVVVHARTVKPKVTTAQLAAKYPTVITVDRASFRLRLWKDLKLVKTYTIAVGRAGLETPAGVYTINDKQVNPSWHVPNSAWAGDLAGKTIPPGPDDPIKARWMGIYAGAGIHGTDEIDSLGSAASHGCIRMAIPDVIDLYDRVPLGTTVYIA